MPTFSQSLEQSLHRALAIANERHHQYATLEHLLLSLIDDSDAAAVMRACSVDLDKLRTSLVNYLETEFENLVTDGADDAKPTAGFQRVIQRAVIHVQSSGREEVTGANVLIPGLVVSEGAPKTVLIRAVGPGRDHALEHEGVHELAQGPRLGLAEQGGGRVVAAHTRTPARAVGRAAAGR